MKSLAILLRMVYQIAIMQDIKLNDLELINGSCRKKKLLYVNKGQVIVDMLGLNS